MDKTTAIVIAVDAIIIAITIMYNLEFFIGIDAEPVMIPFASFVLGVLSLAMSMIIMKTFSMLDDKSLQYSKIQSTVLIAYMLAVFLVMTIAFGFAEMVTDDMNVDKKTLKYILTAIILVVGTVMYILLRTKISKTIVERILDNI